MTLVFSCNSIVPAPFARSSRLLFDCVVVMTLPSMKMSSVCNAPTVTTPLTVTLSVIVIDPLYVVAPVTVKSPFNVLLPFTINVPSIVVLSNVVLPSTSKLLEIVTLLLGIKISPVPLARSSKSALETVVVITLSLTLITPLSNSAAFTTRHCFELLPKSYVLL